MYFDKDRLLKELIETTNSSIEPVTLENFEDMSEDDIRDLILIGNERVRHAYRPETLYFQYVARRGRNLTDPLNPSYEITLDDLEKVFSAMRKKYSDFEPEFFTNEHIPEPSMKRLIEYEEGPHRLLSQRNTYLDNLEREFNDMVNNVKQKRPQEYDKGKGPGGFPMRNRGGSGNYGMPAKEPKFKDHLIWLHDPDRRYNLDNTLAYDYNLFPKNKYLFCPGNSKPGQIQSQKMPDWMTTDPSKRDKVSFMDNLQSYNKPEKPILNKTSSIQEYYYEPTVYFEEPPMGNGGDKKENINLWLIIAFILFVFLLKKRRY
jgi:hypothetical protein